MEAVTFPDRAFIFEIKLLIVSDEDTVTVPEFPDRSVMVKDPSVMPDPAFNAETGVEVVNFGLKSLPKTSDPGSVKSVLVLSSIAILNLSEFPKYTAPEVLCSKGCVRNAVPEKINWFLTFVFADSNTWEII
tara:strand:- start:30 stop:425 length:396 start_codon:yes stop_codon:yes gene_type:complete